MPRRSRILRILKWIATATSALVVVIYVVNFWCTFGVSHNTRPIWSAYIGQNSAKLLTLHMTDVEYARHRVRLQQNPAWRFHLFETTSPTEGLSWPSITRDSSGMTLIVPLWVLLATALLPTLLLWRLDRRPPPGHCPCGYNLTGNTTGRCPECGRPCAAEAAPSTAEV